jgi:nitroreductase
MPHTIERLRMDLQETIYARRAVREYTTEVIDDQTIRQLIDAAIQAPSAVNEQPWSFSVVRDKAVLAQISNESRAYILRTPPTGIASHHLRELISDSHHDILYHAPALIVISSVVENEWAIENCSLAAENLMLAARAAGLGSCWIGFAQAWLATPQGRAAIQVPMSYLPVAPIIVGHPAAWPPPVPRKKPEVKWIG